MADLESYFETTIPNRGCRRNFWSAMAELTPASLDIISRPYFGLRGFAQLVNLNVTYWFERPEWYSNSMIIATDFYLGNNIVEMSVKVNQNGAVCSKNHNGKH